MKSTLRMIFVLLLLSGWALAAAALYIVRLPEGFIGIVPKDRLSFVDTYVDIRGWTAEDADRHPELIRRLMDAKKVDWLSSIVGLTPPHGDDAIRDALQHAPNATSQPKNRSRSAAPHR